MKCHRMTKVEFNQIEKLYHFTSFESAIKIIASHKLRYSPIQGLNDINESYRSIFAGKFQDIAKVQREIQKYRQISLTRDIPQLGFLISAMWGHYAQKGLGACLIFNQQILQSQLDSGTYSKAINYQKYDNTIVVPNITDIAQYIEEHRIHLFFRKTDDWSYEQEFRIIKKSETDEYLDYGDALVGIILCYASDIKSKNSVFESVQYTIIRQMNIAIPIFEYGTLFGSRNLRDANGNEIYSDNN